MLNLGALPWSAARRAADDAALRLPGGAVISHGTLDRLAAGAAAALERAGAVRGAPVALLCGNGAVFPALYYGALRMGAVAAPLSTASAPAELVAALRALRTRVVVADAAHADAALRAARDAGTGARTLVVSDAGRHAGAVDLASLEASGPDPVPVGAADPAVILATSGTTGTPRRAVHSHTGLLCNARAVAGEMLGLHAGDVQLGALPLAHSFGMSAVLNASVLAGASVALLPRFEPAAVVGTMASAGVTVMQAVPTMLRRLADDAPDRAVHPRLVVVSGAPLPDGLAARVHARFRTRVIERYGMTEVSPLTMRDVDAGGGIPGDVGSPLWGVVVRVVDGADEGELEVCAPSMFLGYHRDRRATAAVMAAGMMRTGDLGKVQDGRVLLTGRLKDVIVRGGNNVSALEVERVLETHPAVVEVAVVGVPDADLGEEIAAIVVLRPGMRTAAGELEQRCREVLAAYKRPRLWYRLDALPRTASGKVRRQAARQCLDGAERLA